MVPFYTTWAPTISISDLIYPIGPHDQLPCPSHNKWASSHSVVPGATARDQHLQSRLPPYRFRRPAFRSVGHPRLQRPVATALSKPCKV